jgi:spermidine synthase
MIARELLGTAQVPGVEELTLYRHDQDFMIVLGNNELMSTRRSGSEIALATLSCDRIAGRKKPRILIGGYGMGFTLRAALEAWGGDAEITVAELVPEIISWARGPMANLMAGCLDDPRVQLTIGDVGDVIEACPDTFDAILLDVDNGPDGLVREDNNRLYSRFGLRAARAALRPGGVLAIWSVSKDHAFRARLQKARFDVDEVSVRARTNGKGPKHVIWFATPA